MIVLPIRNKTNSIAFNSCNSAHSLHFTSIRFNSVEWKNTQRNSNNSTQTILCASVCSLARMHLLCARFCSNANKSMAQMVSSRYLPPPLSCCLRNNMSWKRSFSFSLLRVRTRGKRNMDSRVPDHRSNHFSTQIDLSTHRDAACKQNRC